MAAAPGPQALGWVRHVLTWALGTGEREGSVMGHPKGGPCPRGVGTEGKAVPSWCLSELALQEGAQEMLCRSQAKWILPLLKDSEFPSASTFWAPQPFCRVTGWGGSA